MTTQLKTFDSLGALQDAALALIASALCCDPAEPFAVMLSGGRTPVPIYEALALTGIAAGQKLHLMLSDERMVPFDSPDSNYGLIVPMIQSLSLHEQRVIRVDTTLPLNNAASAYNDEIEDFLGRGRISLAILGLGPDGHTASLFPGYNLAGADGLYAVPAPRTPGPDRVSVSPLTLAKAEHIVFLATGMEKEAMVNTLQNAPSEIMAGRAVSDADNVEIWYSEQSISE